MLGNKQLLRISKYAKIDSLFSLLSRVFSFQNLKCDVPGKFQLDPLDIVLRSPKIAKFLNLEW